MRRLSLAVALFAAAAAAAATDMVYEEVRRQTLAGRSDYQMKPDVVKKLAAYRGWANFEDEVGRQIGFALQEAEAE